MAVIPGNTKLGYEHYIEWQESDVNVANNTSVVTAFLKVKKVGNNSSSYNNNYHGVGLTINGNTITGSIQWDMRYASIGTELTLISHSVLVSHENDGTKTVNINGYHDLSSIQVGYQSVSGNVALYTIPRASNISATDADIESNSTISIYRANTLFTHTITYTFGSLSGTIVTKTGDVSIVWTVPSSFYTQIPNSKDGTCTLTCTTYSGDTQIGNPTITGLKIIANEQLCKPNISGTVIDSNQTTVNLTGNSSKLIKYKSTASITTSATAKNSSTIVSVTVNGIIGASQTIENVETNTFEIIATDSRGYQNTAIVTCEMVEYIPLTAMSLFKRLSSTSNKVNLTYSGNYFDDTFGSEQNSLTLSYKYREKGTQNWTNGVTSLNPTITNNVFNETIELTENFNYRKNYEFSLFFEDELVSSNTGINDVLKGRGALEIYDTAVVSNGKRVDYHYETNETVVGTWYNGKPIYRKIINTTMPNDASNWTQLETISNVDDIVTLRGILQYSDGRQLLLNQSEWNYLVVLSYYQGYVEIRAENNLYAGSDVILIAEYTKTTD